MYNQIYEQFSKEHLFPRMQRINATRENFAEIFHHFNYKVGAEVGTRLGEYAEVLLKGNADLKLYCIDPYAPYSETRRQESQDKNMEEAHKRLQGYNVVFVRKYSAEASGDFKDQSLDFVYIDGAHDKENVAMDIMAWFPKVRKGGIFSGHDYFIKGGYSYVQVVPAVNDFFLNHPELEMHVTIEKYPSWFCIKP